MSFSGLVNLHKAGSFNGEHQCGTPVTAVTVTNIKAAENIIRAIPWDATQEIWECFSIRLAKTESIIHHHFHCLGKQIVFFKTCQLIIIFSSGEKY